MSPRANAFAAAVWLPAVGTAGRMLVQLRWTAPLLLAASLLASAMWRPLRELGEAGGSGIALWLHVPCFFWTAAVLAAGLESWPAFAHGQAGADHVLRLRPGPLQGCGAASLAVLAIHAVGLVVLGLGFALLTGLGPAHAHLVVPPASADAALTAHRPSVALRAPAERVQELRLRPLAFLPAGDELRPTRIELLSGGMPLHGQPLSVEGSGELLRVVFPPRRLRDLEVRAAGPVGLPLWFGDGRVVALSARAWPGAVNGTLACLSYVLPAAVALSLVCCAGPHLGLPVATLLALVTLVLTSVAGLVPTGAAVRSLVAGRQVLDGESWRHVLPSLSVAFLAIICAMRTRGRSTG